MGSAFLLIKPAFVFFSFSRDFLLRHSGCLSQPFSENIFSIYGFAFVFFIAVTDLRSNLGPSNGCWDANGLLLSGGSYLKKIGTINQNWIWNFISNSGLNRVQNYNQIRFLT